MKYISITIILVVLELLYFKIADHYKIIDKPNERSAHTKFTIRGGGIVYFLAFLLYLIYYSFHPELQNFTGYEVFGFGFLIICAVSFLDDLFSLSTVLRLVIHFVCVSALFWFLGFFSLSLWLVALLYILSTGVLNSYNFMDGINGMNGLYSLVTFGTLFYINQAVLAFTDKDFIIFPLVATIVFLFFNLRKRALCFAGDIGSFGASFWILALLGLLILKTQDIKYLLFLSVYGVEVVLTIFERLKLKENVLKAHRRHLYQLYANELSVPHTTISTVYALLQAIINILVIHMEFPWMITGLIILLPLVVLYSMIKLPLKKRIFGQFF